MGVRREGRRLAVQFLYQAHIRKENNSELETDFFTHLNSKKRSEAANNFAKELILSVRQYQSEFDALIESYSIGWAMDRINPIDLNIMRVSFYEIIYAKTPVTIVLNEAVELAKEFSEDDSSKFINGILGKYVKDHVHRDS